MNRKQELAPLPVPSRQQLPSQPAIAPVRIARSISPGDLFLRPFRRMEAQSRAMTYRAIASEFSAEADAAQAAANLRRAYTDRAVAWAEYDELPTRLAEEAHARRLRRRQEIREIEQDIALSEADFQIQMTRRSTDLMNTLTDLTLARANCTAARQRLLDATQSYLSQAQYGGRHYDLMWERKIGEDELYVEEQRTLLDEHRQRTGLTDRTAAHIDATRVDITGDVEPVIENVEVMKPRRPWRR